MSKNKKSFLFLLVIFLLSLVFYMFGSAGYKNSERGVPLPRFKLKSIYDTNVSFDDIQDKIYVINFFASWCGACHNYNRALMQINSNKKLPIYGISVDDNFDQLHKMLLYYGNPYKDVAIDSLHRSSYALSIQTLPQMLVIKNGNIIKRYIGGMNPYDIKTLLDH